jgi:hypothetical protein
MTTRCSGPLFDGSAERAAKRATEAVRHRLADEGEKLAEATLAASIRHHGTGRALRSITQTDRTTAYQTGKYTMPVIVMPNETVVTTDLATYGPWLEGSGSRNLTTRFKGYHSFRRAGQALDGMAEGLAQEAIRPFIEEMNG